LLDVQDKAIVAYMAYYLVTNGSTFVPDAHYLTLLEEKFGEDRISIRFTSNGAVVRLV
jgi:hypothetical protein